jgi:hypothetical protein
MRGDPEEAREVAVAHICDSQTTVIDSLMSSEALQSTHVSIGPRPQRVLLVASGSGV